MKRLISVLLILCLLLGLVCAAGFASDEPEAGAEETYDVTGTDDPASVEETAPADAADEEAEDAPVNVSDGDFDGTDEPPEEASADTERAEAEYEIPSDEDAPVLDGAAPAAPANLRWDGQTGKWDAVTGAAKYKVELFRVADGAAVSIGTATPTVCEFEFSRIDTSETSTYYFTVKAVNTDGEASEAAKSPDAEFSPVPAPGNPRWDGKTAKWDAVAGQDIYYLVLYRETGEGENSVWYGFLRDGVCEKDLAAEIDTAGEGAFYFLVGATDDSRYFYGFDGFETAKSEKLTVGSAEKTPLPEPRAADLDWSISDEGHLIATWAAPSGVPSDADYAYSVSLRKYQTGSGSDPLIHTVELSRSVTRYDFTAAGYAPAECEDTLVFGVRLVPTASETKYCAGEEETMYSFNAVTPATDLVRTVDARIEASISVGDYGIAINSVVRAGDTQITLWPDWTGGYGSVYYYRLVMVITPTSGSPVTRTINLDWPGGRLTGGSTGRTYSGYTFQAGDVVDWTATLTNFSGSTVFATKTGSFTVEASVPHTVTLKANGHGQDGSVTVEDRTSLLEAAGYEAALPQAEGMEVTGWSKVQKPQEEYTIEDLLNTDDLRVTEDMTLYAVWGTSIDTVELEIATPVCGADGTDTPDVKLPMDAMYYDDSYPWYSDLMTWGTLGADGTLTPLDGTFLGGRDYSFRMRLEDYARYARAAFAPEDELTVDGNFKSSEIVSMQRLGSYNLLTLNVTVTAEHDWGEWETTKEATTTETGLKQRVCAACGEKQTEVIPLETHNWSAWTVTKAATCTEDGERTRTCSDCGLTETEVIPAAHTWGEWSATTQATCTEDGERTRTCSVCGATETETITAPGHDWSDWKVTKAATATRDGERERTCSVCGTTETEVIPAEGYKFLEGMNSTWTLGGTETLRLRANGELADFDHAEMDGETIDEENYTTAEGSTILELYPAYLNTLSAGRHTLAAVYTDGGRAETSITVRAKTPAPSAPAGAPGSPRTGDETHILLWVLLFALSSAGVVLAGKKKRYTGK